MSINIWTDKLWYIHTMNITQHKKELTIDPCQQIYESQLRSETSQIIKKKKKKST